MGGAALLNEGKADICVNWAGERLRAFLRGLGKLVGIRRGISMLKVCEAASCARPSATAQSRSSASCTFINVCVLHMYANGGVCKIGLDAHSIHQQPYAGLCGTTYVHSTWLERLCSYVGLHGAMNGPFCTLRLFQDRLTRAMLCRRHASREEGRSIRLLLRERHCACHPGAAARAPAVRNTTLCAQFQRLCLTCSELCHLLATPVPCLVSVPYLRACWLRGSHCLHIILHHPNDLSMCCDGQRAVCGH